MSSRNEDSLNEELTRRGRAGGPGITDDDRALESIPFINLSDSYEVLADPLGEGGMGTVTKARLRGLPRFVAIKRMQPELRSQAGYQLRFIEEAKAVARLNHGNIVKIENWGRDHEGPFLVLEFIHGEDLAQRVRREGPLSLELVVEIGCAACAGLQHAHDQGIIHRDIKPHNILISHSGDVKLTDFGLVRQLDSGQQLSCSGAVLGSLPYMAPEQRDDARQADARSDLWSLGATLYHLLTGHVPPVSMRFDVNRLPEPLRSPLQRVLQPYAADRFQTAREFADALRSLTQTPAMTPFDAKTAMTARESWAKQESWAKSVGTAIELTNRIGMKLRLIPPGEFLMGSTDNEASFDEGPLHAVRIRQPFFAGVYPVTQAEYAAVMGSNPAWFAAGGGGGDQISEQNTDRFPVESISWYDAIEFCNCLSEREQLPVCYALTNVERRNGRITSATIKTVSSSVSTAVERGYRLPTEAEWEYFCRAGTTSSYSFGNVLNGNQANVQRDSADNTGMTPANHERPTPIGSYAANAFGLFDVHGNVWEWCFDVYNAAAYDSRKGLTEDPVSENGSEDRVIRGGSWSGCSRFARSAMRFRNRPIYRFHNLGFRVVR